MEELYEYMKSKHDEMYENKEDKVTINYAMFAQLFQLVCYMKQIRTIANGWE